MNAFDKKYGPQYRGSYNAALYRNAQYQLSLLVVTDGKVGEQDTSHDRVISIDAYPLVEITDWDLKTVEHICTPFMPPDSRYVKDLNGPNKGEVLHIYYSQLLANTLPSSDFVISSGNLSIKGRPVTPGLFTVGYNNFFTVSPKQFIECGLGAGIDYLAVG